MHSGIAAALLILTARAIAPAQEIRVELSGDTLRVSAPSFHFVSGKALEQLRDGTSVAFDIQVSILADSRQTVLRRAFERFVFSYDVWEERFSVTRMRSTRSSAGHLPAKMAESWCLERLSLPTTGLPVDKPLSVRIDVRAQEGRSRQALEDESEGFSLAGLIELFSRPAKLNKVSEWRAESAPFQIAGLRRVSP